MLDRKARIINTKDLLLQIDDFKDADEIIKKLEKQISDIDAEVAQRKENDLNKKYENAKSRYVRSIFDKAKDDFFELMNEGYKDASIYYDLCETKLELESTERDLAILQDAVRRRKLTIILRWILAFFIVFLPFLWLSFGSFASHEKVFDDDMGFFLLIVFFVIIIN